MPTPIPNIWALQSKGDVGALIEALRHPEPTTRRGAAAALRALDAWQAVPALQAALAGEQDWQAHAAIAATLQYLDRDVHIQHLVQNKDIPGLAKMLGSSNIEDVKAACRALGDLGNRQAVEPLVILFRNPLMPNAARLAAAEALLKLESAPAVVTLLGALRRDNWQVRRNAAAVLGQLQAGWATEALIVALNDPHQAVQRTAAAALRRISTPEAIRAADAFEEIQKHVGTQPLKPLEPAETPPSTPPTVAAPVEPVSEASTIQPTGPQSTLLEAAQPSTAASSPDEIKTVDLSVFPPASSPVVDTPIIPISGHLPRPPWLHGKAEPPTSSDDTKPSRPTSLRSPLQQANTPDKDEQPTEAPTSDTKPESGDN